MKTRWGAAIVVALLTAPVSAQAPARPEPGAGRARAAGPKTPWGDPDLRGTFTSDNSIGVPFERPAQYGDRPMLTDTEFDAREKANLEQIAKDNSERPETAFEQDEAANNAPRHWLERGTKLSHASSLVIDPQNGRLPPLTPDGQRRQAQNRARFFRQDEAAEFHSYYDRCITRGVISSILPAIYGNGTRIEQGPGVVVIRNEMIHEARVMPIDSRTPRLGKNIHLYMGDPRGHWDGAHARRGLDELHGQARRRRRHPSPARACISSSVSRRTAPDTIHYEFTVDDPETFTATWTAALELNMKSGYEIYEYACHEGNYGLRNMLSASRADDRASAPK